MFGRYPVVPDGNRYPVLDLVVCHGIFLNADNSYQHKNKSFRGFGSYGDILVRDRKMYVAPTPFALADGAAHHRTLILPDDMPVDDDLVEIATLTRREVERMVVAYNFDLRTNTLRTELVPNPNAGKERVFKAYRMKGDPMTPVALVEHSRGKARRHIRTFSVLMVREAMTMSDDAAETLSLLPDEFIDNAPSVNFH